jgi:hypothetical protein
MPITIQLPEGIFSKDEDAKLVVGLTELLIEVNGATENSFVRRHLVVAVSAVPASCQYQRVLSAKITLSVPLSYGGGFSDVGGVYLSNENLEEEIVSAQSKMKK